MKIILANYRYYVSGGPEIYMFNVKRLLEDEGHTVIPFSVRSPLNEETPYSCYFPHGKSESGDAYFDNVKKTPKNIARLLSCAFYNREAYRNLRRLIRGERPDAVYVLQQINALSPSVFKACRDEGVRVVHRLSDFNMMCPRSDFLCDGEVCEACLHGDYGKALERRCCHGSKATTLVRVSSMKYHQRRDLFGCVDAFVCPTRFTASKLVESGVPAPKVHVLPTFVDAPSRGTLAGSESGGYALYLGRISPEKGVDLLVRSVADRPSVRLKITGSLNDPYASSVATMARDLGVGDRVEFVGFVKGEEKTRLIAGSSCVVCPSVWYENMPNAVLEAYSYSKPVVAFDIGCMPELVKDGETGVVVPLGDGARFGEAVESLCSDRDLAREMGDSAKRFVLSEYSSDSHLSRLLAILAPSGARKE